MLIGTIAARHLRLLYQEACFARLVDMEIRAREGVVYLETDESRDDHFGLFREAVRALYHLPAETLVYVYESWMLAVVIPILHTPAEPIVATWTLKHHVREVLWKRILYYLSA
jgi:hypothetical protein